MNAPSIDIKDYLVSAGIGSFAATDGWAIYVSREPVSPDTCITLYDTGGFEPHYGGYAENPTVQIRVRGAPNGYPAAYNKINEIKKLLLSGSFVVNNTKYLAWLAGDIVLIGYDESSRPIFTLNLRLTREES